MATAARAGRRRRAVISGRAAGISLGQLGASTSVQVADLNEC